MVAQIELYATDSSRPILVRETFFEFCKKPCRLSSDNELLTNRVSSQNRGRCLIPDASVYSENTKFYYDCDYETLKKIVEWIDHYKQDMRMKQRRDTAHDFLRGCERLEIMSQGFELSNHYAELKNRSVLAAWDVNFLNMPFTKLVTLLVKSKEFEVMWLYEMCAQTIANKLKGISTKKIKPMFNITEQLSPKQLEEIKMEYGFIEN